MKKQTLVILLKKDQVLLGMKKRGFGVGRWNGFGGKVNQDESILEAAKREVKEEAGVKVSKLLKSGVLTFEFLSNKERLEVHIYKAFQFAGEVVESVEMKPQWFALDSIPYQQMWPDDIYWLPLLLEGKKFKGKFIFDKPSSKNYVSKIIKRELVEI